MDDFTRGFETSSAQKPKPFFFKPEKPEEEPQTFSGNGKDVRVFDSPDSPGFSPELMKSFPEWLSRYFKSKELEVEKKTLQAKRKEVETAPPDRSEVLSKLKGQFDHNAEKRQAIIVGRIRMFQEPFDRLTGDDDLKESFLPFTWAEIETAVESLPEGLTSKDKEEKLKQIDARLVEIEKELQSVNQGRYVLQTVETSIGIGTAPVDGWALFLNHWRRVQSKMCRPCDPEGFSLEDSPQGVKDAWKALKLRVGGPHEPRERSRSTSDIIGRFISDCCILNPLAKCRIAELYAEFVRWCSGRKKEPITIRNFSTVLQERGLKRDRIGSSGSKGFKGIGLRSLTTDQPTDPSRTAGG
jgi:hypothetical protein